MIEDMTVFKFRPLDKQVDPTRRSTVCDSVGLPADRDWRGSLSASLSPSWPGLSWPVLAITVRAGFIPEGLADGRYGTREDRNTRTSAIHLVSAGLA
jgi:hypothetical protein